MGSPGRGHSPCLCPLGGGGGRAGRAPHWAAPALWVRPHARLTRAVPCGTARPCWCFPDRDCPGRPGGTTQPVPNTKHSPGPRAAPFTGHKLSSPLPVNPYRPRAGNWGRARHTFRRVCDFGAPPSPSCAWPGPRGITGALPAVTGPWLTAARGSVPARCRLPDPGDSCIPRRHREPGARRKGGEAAPPRPAGGHSPLGGFETLRAQPGLEQGRDSPAEAVTQSDTVGVWPLGTRDGGVGGRGRCWAPGMLSGLATGAEGSPRARWPSGLARGRL